MVIAVGLAVAIGQAAIVAASLSPLLTAALSLGLAVIGTVATMLLTPKPAVPKMEDGKLTLRQAIPARVKVFGRARMGGPLAYYGGGSTLNQVILHAEHRIGEFETHWLNDEIVDVNEDGEVESRPYHDAHATGTDEEYHVMLTNYIGTDTQTVSAYLDSNWTSTNHYLRGQACTSIAYDDGNSKTHYKIFPNGAPSYSAVMKGALLFDPRNPFHNINDPDTWTWSDNSALAVLDYLTRRQQGVPDGFGLDWDEINLQSFADAADDCDEFVALKAGGSERRWRTWGAYELTEDRSTVLSDLLGTCCGWLAQGVDGKVVIQVGREAPTATVTITDDQFKTWRLRAGVNAIDRVNGVRATYLSENHKWNEIEAGIQLNQDSIDRNGEEFTDAKLRFCPSESQAQRLAKYTLKRGDPKFSGEITGTLALLNAWGERFINLQLTELTTFNGMYEVIGLKLDRATMMVTLTVSSYDDWWGWNAATDEKDPSLVPEEPEEPMDMDPPTSATATVDSRTTDGRTRYAVGVITWPAPPRNNWSSEVEYRPVTTPESDWLGISPAYGFFRTETGVLQEGLTYRARVRYVGPMGTVSDWRETAAFAAVADPIAPGVGTLSASLNGYTVNLLSTAPNDAHVGSVRFFRNTVNNFVGAVQIAGPYIVAPNQQAAYSEIQVPGDYYYFAQWANWSGISGAATPGQLIEVAPTTAPRILVPTSGFTSYDRTQPISGDQAYANSTVRIYANGVLNTTTTASPTGVWSTTTAALPTGAVSLTASSVSGGNEGPLSTAVTGTINALDTDAAAIIAAFTNEPSSARMGLINDLVVGLKTDNLWTKLRRLQVLAAHDSQASTIEWKTKVAGFTATTANSDTPVFTVDRGWKANGAGTTVGGYLSGTDNSVNLAQNDNSMFVWNHAPSSGAVAGTYRECGSGQMLIACKNPTAVVAAINMSGSINSIAQTGDGTGFYGHSRTASTGYKVYQDVNVLGTVTQASATPVSGTMHILRGGSGYCDARVSACGWGAGMTDADMLALRNRLRTYMVAVGAAV